MDHSAASAGDVHLIEAQAAKPPALSAAVAVAVAVAAAVTVAVVVAAAVVAADDNGMTTTTWTFLIH